MAELRTIARPYARAAFAIAQRHNEIALWKRALSMLKQLWTDDTMRAGLNGPLWLSQDVMRAALSAMGEGFGETTRIHRFVTTLVLRKRLPLLAEIHTLFEQYHAAADGRVKTEIVSARALDAGERERICSALQKRLGRSIDAVYDVDASLLSGAVIRVGDRVIDGSLRSRLEHLADALKH